MNNSVIILRFSTRGNGNCEQISDFVREYYNRTNVLTFTIDTQNFAPCGGCDYQCLRVGQECPKLTTYQKNVMNAIMQSDLVYYIIPNYCGYPCANYFAFNERSVGFFNMDRELLNRYMKAAKRFIIVSNSEGQNFEDAMKQQTNDSPEILYMKTRKYQKQSIAGDIMSSAAAKSDLLAFLSGDMP